MKKYWTLLISAVCVCSILLNGVLFTKMNQVTEKAETELGESLQTIVQLQQEKSEQDVSNQVVEQNMPQAESKQVQIEGAFVAMVRDKIPNYVLDDTTPNTLVVTMFQEGPFLISTGSLGNLVETVEADKFYVFEIEPKIIGTFNESELDYTALSPDIAMSLYHLQVENIYEVDDEELYSKNDKQLRYVMID